MTLQNALEANGWAAQYYRNGNKPDGELVTTLAERLEDGTIDVTVQLGWDIPNHIITSANVTEINARLFGHCFLHSPVKWVSAKMAVQQ